MQYSLVDSNALVLMTLCCNHHVGFIQHEHANLLYVKYTELAAPIKHLPGRTNDDVVIQLCTASNYRNVIKIKRCQS